MYCRDDIGRIISDRFVQRAGKNIPYYLAKWMVDYVFEGLKIALIEDGKVTIRNVGTITRTDIPEHEKVLPNGNTIMVKPKVKIKFVFSDKFVNDILEGKFEEIDKTYAR